MNRRAVFALMAQPEIAHASHAPLVRPGNRNGANGIPQHYPVRSGFIADLSIGGSAPVTLAGMDLPWHTYFDDRICWARGFHGTMDNAYGRSTLIHELCHVWQGEHGVWPTVYMAQSVTDQLVEGAKDILKTRKWRGWLGVMRRPPTRASPTSAT